jgi:hypothetical protein
MGDVRKVFGVKGFPLTGMPECKETKWIVMTAYAGLNLNENLYHGSQN